MQTKSYSSFDEIDNDLAILRIEREIHLRKASLGLQKTKELLSPEVLVSNAFQSFTGGSSGLIGTVAGIIVIYLLKRIRNWHKN